TDECCTAEPLRDRRRTSHRVFPYFLRDPGRDRGRDHRRRSDAVGPVDDVRRQAVPIARRDGLASDVVYGPNGIAATSVIPASIATRVPQKIGKHPMRGPPPIA